MNILRNWKTKLTQGERDTVKLYLLIGGFVFVGVLSVVSSII
jgi:hypothetical protein